MSKDSNFSMPLPIAVLVSGAGTNLEALFKTVHGHEAEIVAVGSNIGDAPALRRARARKVPTKVFSRAKFSDRQERDAAMADWLVNRGARVVVLAGFMELLSESFLSRFSAVINIHPSLLPAFPGLGAIDQALAAKANVVGVTVHFVDSGVDTGPIILQDFVELGDVQDPAEVLRMVRPLEHRLLPEAVRRIASEYAEQAVLLAA